MRNLIRSLFALFVVTSPAVASATEYVTLTGTVGSADSTCNAEVSPQVFPLADDTVVELQLVVPLNSTIDGWLCDADLCTRRFDASYLDENGVHMESLLIVGPNPQQTFGVTIALAEPELARDTFALSMGLPKYPPVCCACPCNFAPTCS